MEVVFKISPTDYSRAESVWATGMKNARACPICRAQTHHHPGPERPTQKTRGRRRRLTSPLCLLQNPHLHTCCYLHCVDVWPGPKNTESQPAHAWRLWCSQDLNPGLLASPLFIFYYPIEPSHKLHSPRGLAPRPSYTTVTSRGVR